jgi:NAD+ synthase
MLSASAGDAPRTDPAATARVLEGALACEVRRAGFARGIVGLSGGVDSAVSCALAARALGPGNVLAVALPVAGSSPAAMEHARLAAAAAMVELRVVDLGPAVAAMEKALPGSAADRVRRGNLAARARMLALYDLSASEKALVVGTSNKTEMLLGYTTLWGDMAAAIQPLGDLYKCEVRALARHLGVPAPVIEKAPSADLWEGQTDEGELGFSYDDADRVLYQWLDCRRRPEEMIRAGVPEPLFRAIERRVLGSAYKRRLPLVLKVSSRTVSHEFRLPRDAGT